MATSTEIKNLEFSGFFSGTATTVAALVQFGPKADGAVAAHAFGIQNVGTVPLRFSLDGQVVWMTLLPGASFDWHRRLYAVAVKTDAGTAGYEIAVGY